MLPYYDSEKHSDLDFFIIDECDSMMLDTAEMFQRIYESLNKNVGGLFFLTATKFEETKTDKSNEEKFVRMMPNLSITNCFQEKHVKESTHTRMGFSTTDKFVLHIKGLCSRSPIVIWVRNETNFRIKKTDGR